MSGRVEILYAISTSSSERCLLRWESEGLLSLQGSPIFFFLFEFFDERNTRIEKRIIIKSLSLSSVHAEICVRRVLPKLSTPDCRVWRYKHVKKQQNTTRSSGGFFNSFLHTANYYIILSTKKVNRFIGLLNNWKCRPKKFHIYIDFDAVANKLMLTLPNVVITD